MKATRLVVTAVFPNVEPSTQALRGARNILSSPAGRELINTVVQVGAFKENNHNKRYIKHQEYRFRCFRPRPPLLLLLSLPHCECPVAEQSSISVSVKMLLQLPRKIHSVCHVGLTVKESCDSKRNVILLYVAVIPSPQLSHMYLHICQLQL